MSLPSRSVATASVTVLAIAALVAGVWLPGLVGNALLIAGAIAFSRGVATLTRGWA